MIWLFTFYIIWKENRYAIYGDTPENQYNANTELIFLKYEMSEIKKWNNHMCFLGNFKQFPAISEKTISLL